VGVLFGGGIGLIFIASAFYDGHAAVLKERTSFYQVLNRGNEQEILRKKDVLANTIPTQACLTLDLHNSVASQMFFQKKIVKDWIEDSLSIINVGSNDISKYCQQLLLPSQ